jgi:hypothetical protein
MKSIILPILLIIFCFTSCKKKVVVTTTPATKKNIFIAGHQQGATGAQAVQWFNGVETLLGKPNTNGDGMRITDCALIGTDKYVIGNYDSSSSSSTIYGLPRYWKNGIEYKINTTNVSSFPKAISNIGIDVYILCQEFSAANIGTYTRDVVVYKNGVAIFATTTYLGDAYDLQCDASNWYILLDENTGIKQQIVYIKNGTKITLPPSADDQFARKMCLINGDVNIIGTSYNAAGKRLGGMLYNNGASVIVFANGESINIINYKNNPMVFGMNTNNKSASWYQTTEKSEPYFYLDNVATSDGKIYSIASDNAGGKVFEDGVAYGTFGINSNTVSNFASTVAVY